MIAEIRAVVQPGEGNILVSIHPGMAIQNLLANYELWSVCNNMPFGLQIRFIKRPTEPKGKGKKRA